MNVLKTSLFTILTAVGATGVLACGLCGTYTPTLEVAHAQPYSFYGSVAEQFTYYGTDLENGRKASNPTGEYLDSSITQLIVGTTFLDNRFGIQVNVPLIYRSYQSPVGLVTNQGRSSGLGDVSLLANFLVVRKDALYHDSEGAPWKEGSIDRSAERGDPDFSVRVNLTAGVKFPTGDDGLLTKDFRPVSTGSSSSGGSSEHATTSTTSATSSAATAAATAVTAASPANSIGQTGIHGHDLALGTGAYDGLFGAQVFMRYKSVFFQVDTLYTVRGSASNQYRLANDFAWSGGPGIYLARHRETSFGLQCVVSGVTKGFDEYQGQPFSSTGLTAVYIGPKVTANFQHVNGEIGVDLPILTDASGFQITLDYRIRAALTITF